MEVGEVVSISISIKDPNWVKIAKQENIVGGKPSSLLNMRTSM
jgi:hypothetical protein